MKTKIILLSLGVAFLLGGHAVAQSGPVDITAALRGTWKVEMDQYPTPEGKPNHSTMKLKNICWKSNEYMACNQLVDGDSKVLIVYLYNETEKSYTTVSINAKAPQPASGKLTITGNTWIYPWQSEENDKITYSRVVNLFVSPTLIEFRQEHSTDGLHWAVTMKGTTERLSAE